MQGYTIYNLSAGVYDLSLYDASSCASTQSFKIAGPSAPLSIFVNASEITCETAHSYPNFVYSYYLHDHMLFYLILYTIVRYRVDGGKAQYNVTLTPHAGIRIFL